MGGEPAFSNEVEAALSRGRAAYRDRDFRAARAADEEALAAAETNPAGQARALRYLGVIAYRTGGIEQSRLHLERARAITTDIGWADEELRVCNHLGATLRKLGRLDEAHAVFTYALAQATGPDRLATRAGLCGSYGAFLDDLGDVHAAAEQYARNDELSRLLPDPARQANARGLVSRAARLRGDHEYALRMAEEERKLGFEAGDRTKEGRGCMHVAQARAAQGRADAEVAFHEASSLLDGADARTQIGLHRAYGAFLLEQGRLHDADAEVRRALDLVGKLAPNEHEHRARVSLLASEVANKAGLYGEALWHLTNAAESQVLRFEPIRDERLRRYTQGRRAELMALAVRILADVDRVEHDAAQVRSVRELLARLDVPHDRHPADDEPARGWRERVRAEAEERWRRLLPGAFEDLQESRRSALIAADVLGHGVVGDLSQGLFLVIGVFEQELKERAFADRRRVSLGQMLHKNNATRLPQPLRQTAQERVPKVDRELLEPVSAHRNAIAHGCLARLSRLDADAYRRHLTLGNGALLPATLALPKVPRP